jgi:hypothetical protein
MIDREKDVVEWAPIPPRPRRKRLVLLIACALLLLLCTYMVGRPKDPDGLLGPLAATRFKFGGTNAWTYMHMKFTGGGIQRIIRLGPIEVMVLDRGVETTP